MNRANSENNPHSDALGIIMHMQQQGWTAEQIDRVLAIAVTYWVPGRTSFIKRSATNWEPVTRHICDHFRDRMVE